MKKRLFSLLVAALVAPALIDSSTVHLHAFAQSKPVIVQPKDLQQTAARKRARDPALASFLKKITALTASVGSGAYVGSSIAHRNAIRSPELAKFIPLYALLGGALTGICLYGVTNKTINSIVNKIMSEAYYEPGWSALSVKDVELLFKLLEVALHTLADELKKPAPKPQQAWGSSSGYTAGSKPNSAQSSHNDEVPGKKKKPSAAATTSSTEAPAPSAPPAESYYTPAPSAPSVYVPSNDPTPVAEYYKPSAPSASLFSDNPSNAGSYSEDPC